MSIKDILALAGRQYIFVWREMQQTLAHRDNKQAFNQATWKHLTE